MPEYLNSLNTKRYLFTDSGDLSYYSLAALSDTLPFQLERMPYSMRILLENLLRHEDGFIITAEDIKRLAQRSGNTKPAELPLFPARVLLQDFTGVPAVVDMAAMRDAAQRLYGAPLEINPVIPAELVIDHSVQVDYYGTADALEKNSERDYERNLERYAFLRWGQKSFGNFWVIPPATGICHQVNLEYLGRVVCVRERNREKLVFPDTLVGLDSHTTMINGLGVLGWGVGGIEAEAVMLGSPYYLLTPEVVGVRLTGSLGPGITATDLVLTITELLRKKGVVGKFVEFFGPGLSTLRVEDRATIANMAPEYGATMGFFPVDDKTIHYLKLTGRNPQLVSLVETYCKTQKLFREDAASDPVYDDVVELEMGQVVTCLAGPKRPQDRASLNRLKSVCRQSFGQFCEDGSDEHNPIAKPVWEQEGGAIPSPDNKWSVCDYGWSTGGCHSIEWPADTDQSWDGGDRGHHQLYQYLQSRSPDCSRASGQKRGGGRTSNALLGQDQSGSGFQGCHPVSEGVRTPGLAGKTEFSSGRLWLHHLHREQWPASGSHRTGCPGP